MPMGLDGHNKFPRQPRLTDRMHTNGNYAEKPMKDLFIDECCQDQVQANCDKA